MTADQKHDTRSVVPAQMDRRSPTSRPESRSSGHARPRTTEDDEAYLRSVMEQAKIDIAAGW